ncbi:MAG: hypothetical protein M3Z14_01660 [Candidatus Eremiobacteraeota bacterium]|nr:hypothetical protein [Candidatus Eremiobacteraeota bacterium]
MDFRGLARVTRTFKVEMGHFRAQGAPAVIVSACGLALAAGLMRAINQNAAILPDTLREAKGLVDSLKAERAAPQLKS